MKKYNKNISTPREVGETVKLFGKVRQLCYRDGIGLTELLHANNFAYDRRGYAINHLRASQAFWDRLSEYKTKI